MGRSTPLISRRFFVLPFALPLAVSAAALLAACGGGGDEGGAAPQAAASTASPGMGAGTGTAAQASTAVPGAPSPATTTARACYTVTGNAAAPVTGAIGVLPARGTGVSGYRVLDDARSAGLCYANYRREQVGLPPLTARDALGTSAQNHTAYMLASQTLTHDETSGAPGFTGATANGRIQAVYPTSATAEVVATGNRWTSAAGANLSMTPKDALVVDLINAPFHRAALLGSYGSAGSGFAESVGAGSNGGTSASYYQTIDLADASKGGADNLMVAYPYDGQADVPASWVNNESPNPAPAYAGQTIGYPVTLQAIDTALAFNADTFTITDAQGRNVPCEKVDARTAGMSGAARGLAMCTPTAPLASGTRYSVTVTGTLGGQGVNLNWSFTTL
ncbi:CAP domain-containing protein [Cupriavidus pauculus]|uniref:CAP domain-containing protein n=1 Tax=Cupriavidus pauculus TaxID=82633 RepID=A0A5P2H2T1_9BURK|nr:CAP domain-containing protein [Cupriavidus pauculus]